MEFAMVDDDDEICQLEEEVCVACPLCAYKDGGIVQRMRATEQALTGQISQDKMFEVLCEMYSKHTAPLIRQGKNPLPLTHQMCRIHYTKHVVNPLQQVGNDIHYCARMQEHFKKNIGVKNNTLGTVTLNPAFVQDYVKISRHKLELVKYYNVMRRRQTDTQTAEQPHAFSS
tara:strand:- start:3055 stop:3570 length:516 start_codon:yes stop_codon:yes gene_type:complete